MSVSLSHPESFSSANFFSSLQILRHSAATPITTILFNLELLKQDPVFQRAKPNSQHYLQQALLSTKYLKEIMQQCQDSPPQSSFRVKSALQAVINICQHPQRQGQLISFLKIPNDLQLQGNKLYFQETVICLLNNAFEAYQQHSPNKLVVLLCEQHHQTVTVKVIDGGTGFLRLTDSAYQTTKSDVGLMPHTGTGLKFAQQVVHQHFQGKLKIESYHQRGSTVACCFPLASK